MSLLSDHITPTELSGLSEQDRVLVRAVKIVQSPEDSSTHSASASDRKEGDGNHPPLLGFECIYCSLSPAVTTVRERSKRLNKVFPSSIETMGASLALLKDKHFSAEASLLDQRCRLLPTNAAQEFFSKATRHNPTKDAYLQRCCEIVAERLGIVDVGSQGSKRGITYRSLLVTASPKREVAPSTATSQQRRSPEAERAARSSSSATWQLRDTNTEEEKTNLNLPTNASSGTNNTASSSYASLRRQSSRSSSPERRDDLHEPNALPYLPSSSIIPLVPSPKSLSFIPYGAGFCCPYCVHIPFHLRAVYSYQAEMPTRERALQHFRKCHFFVMPK